jgi:hypothetical protein
MFSAGSCAPPTPATTSRAVSSTPAAARTGRVRPSGARSGGPAPSTAGTGRRNTSRNDANTTTAPPATKYSNGNGNS